MTDKDYIRELEDAIWHLPPPVKCDEECKHCDLLIQLWDNQ